MTEKEALKLAIKAMKSFQSGTNGLYEGEFQEEINAIKEALAQPELKPLTYQKIRDLWARANGLEDCDLCKIDDFIAAVRFVEAVHGIKE